MNRIFICVVMAAIFTIVGTISVLASDIRVQIDGVYAEFDVPPIIVEGRTLLPARAIVEMLGGDVQWDGELRQVHIYKDGINILLTIDDVIAYVNGEAIELDVPPQIIDDRTLVPLRFVAENLGLDIDFRYGTVFIETNISHMVTSRDFILSDGSTLTVFYTHVVQRNAEAAVFFTGQPNVVWHLNIRYAAGYGTAAGLGEQTADHTGFVEWNWRIGSNTTLGDWPVTIVAGGESLRFYITVIEAH